MASLKPTAISTWGDRNAIAVAVAIKNLTCQHLLGEISRSQYREKLAPMLERFNARAREIVAGGGSDEIDVSRYAH